MFCLFAAANAQCGDDNNPGGLYWDFDEGSNDDLSIDTFLLNIFNPQIITHTNRIRAYIRDEKFQTLRQEQGDIRAIDAIYIKSLKISDYNIARALFLSFMAVLEHRKVYVKLPIFKSIAVPLSFEGDSVFYARNKHLPSRIYLDTPAGADGDRDKLQHFFGSAYIAYISEAPKFTQIVGNIIEWGEAMIVLDGADDLRDKRANKQGCSFGRDLLVIENMLPSDYLTFPYEDCK